MEIQPKHGPVMGSNLELIWTGLQAADLGQRHTELVKDKDFDFQVY